MAGDDALLVGRGGIARRTTQAVTLHRWLMLVTSLTSERKRKRRDALTAGAIMGRKANAMVTGETIAARARYDRAPAAITREFVLKTWHPNEGPAQELAPEIIRANRLTNIEQQDYRSSAAKRSARKMINEIEDSDRSTSSRPDRAGQRPGILLEYRFLLAQAQ